MIFIAELCQNHNGDYELLKDMVYAAKDGGADYVKIQSIFADMLTFRESFEKGLDIDNRKVHIKRPYKLEYTRLKQLELTYDQQADFVELCNKINIKPLTTAFNILSIPKIQEIGFDEIKVASYDCGSIPLIKQLKSQFKQIFLSTGATYDTEIEHAAKVLKGNNFSMLHCVTIYPTPLHEFHLSRMDYLKQYTTNVGWSDHSLLKKDGIKGTLAAVYFGASVIERHFSIIDAGKTKDGPISIGKDDIKEIKLFGSLSKKDQEIYLNDIFPNYQITWGNQKRELTDTELLNRYYYRGRFGNYKSDGSMFYNWVNDN